MLFKQINILYQFVKCKSINDLFCSCQVLVLLRGLDFVLYPLAISFHAFPISYNVTNIIDHRPILRHIGLYGDICTRIVDVNGRSICTSIRPPSELLMGSRTQMPCLAGSICYSNTEYCMVRPFWIYNTQWLIFQNMSSYKSFESAPCSVIFILQYHFPITRSACKNVA